MAGIFQKLFGRHEGAPPENPLRAAALREVARVYGDGGMGWADSSGASLVEYVSVFVAHEPRPHYVYVSSGLYRWMHPHELVIRLAVDAGVSAPSFQTAPGWPMAHLVAIAAATRNTQRSPRFNDYVRNLPAADAPCRHVLYAPDGALQPVNLGPAQHLAFVQAVLLDDAQLSAIDRIPQGQQNTVMAEWAARDRLLIWPPRAPVD